jgi:hypothetical protein
LILSRHADDPMTGLRLPARLPHRAVDLMSGLHLSARLPIVPTI